MTETSSAIRGRLLVVDDDPAGLHLMHLQLEESGFEVHCVESGLQCLEMVSKIEPEVILLDIRMPEMSGIETCRRLKENPETATIPVLFITGIADEESITVEALEAGGNDFISKDTSLPILAARVHCQLSIYRSQKQLRQMAATDPLTGVFTRRFLYDFLRREIKSTRRRERSLGLSALMADIDHFKQINDNKGHAEGDKVLKAVTQVMVRATRETDIVSRFGGEEFVIVLPETPLEGAGVAAERMRSRVERDCDATVSIGAAWAGPPEIDTLLIGSETDALIDNLLKEADKALYDAKNEGRNRIVLSSKKRNISNG